MDLTESFDDAGFATFRLLDVLERIPKRKRQWEEMYRAPAPSSKLITNVCFDDDLHEPPYDYFATRTGLAVR